MFLAKINETKGEKKAIHVAGKRLLSINCKALKPINRSITYQKNG